MYQKRHKGSSLVAAQIHPCLWTPRATFGTCLFEQWLVEPSSCLSGLYLVLFQLYCALQCTLFLFSGFCKVSVASICSQIKFKTLIPDFRVPPWSLISPSFLVTCCTPHVTSMAKSKELQSPLCLPTMPFLFLLPTTCASEFFLLEIFLDSTRKAIF